MSGPHDEESVKAEERDATRRISTVSRGEGRGRPSPARSVGGDPPGAGTLGSEVLNPTRRTVPRGGTLLAKLGQATVAPPVELRHVTGQHTIQSELRRVEGRYVVGQELGRGGMGLVRLVKDLDIGRHVAMKTLNPDDPELETLIQPLIAEAQTTGQLEHPNIIPVYELGVLPNQDVFYTMKAVSGMTLKDVFRRLRAGEEHVVSEYTERRLLNIFGQICLAMHYAHNSGVVHRDLKPDNVILGAYGEVLVMDWGIAYVIGRTTDMLAKPGVVVGTPHYMAPEQARGEIHLVDGRTDIFSLGVMLYEILTLCTPITCSDTDLALDEVRAMAAPIRPEADEAWRPVPEPLAEICAQAMHPEREERVPDCRKLYDLIESYLEGSAEKERRHRMAAEELGVGTQAFGRYMELRRSREKLGQRLSRRERHVHRWDSQATKRELWDLKARHGHMDLVVTQAFSTAVNHFRRVIGLVPEQAQARAALANINWARFEEAEKEQDYADMIYFADRVVKFNDSDRGGPLRGGTGRITVRSFPQGVEIVLFDFAKGVPDPRLESGRSLGPSPVRAVELPVGMYLLVGQKEGYKDTHLPIFVRPGETRACLLTMNSWASEEKLVGRAGELDLMKLNLRRACDGRQVRRVLITGSDGMGKARLLSAFSEYIDRVPDNLIFFFAECHEQHALVPYGAVTEALRIRAGIVVGDTLEVVQKRLSAMILSIVEVGGPPTQKDRELISSTVGVLSLLPGMAAGEQTFPLPPRQMRRRFDLALVDVLQLMTRWDPALFYFLQVEQMDDASARVIRKAHDFLKNCPMLLVGIGSGVGSLIGWDDRVHLESLSATAVDALLRDLLKAPLPDGLHDYVMARSGGIPWLVVDTARRLAESYDLYFAESVWHLKSGLEEPTPVGVFEARREMIEELPKRLFDALQLAAVMGDTFWLEGLRDLGVEDVEECIAELTERELIRATPNARYPGMTAFAFRSLIFREIVYTSIQDPDRLASMHRKVADWMRARIQGDIREVAELAHHVELARDEDWAALLFGQLGDSCRACGCFGLARECYQRALTNTVEEEDRQALEKRLNSVRNQTGRRTTK